MTSLTMLFVGGIWKTLGLLVRKAVKYFLWGLMGFTRSSIKDSDAENNVDYDSPAQEVSEEKNVSLWPRDYSCDILERLWLLLLLSENSP